MLIKTIFVNFDPLFTQFYFEKIFNKTKRFSLGHTGMSLLNIFFVSSISLYVDSSPSFNTKIIILFCFLSLFKLSISFSSSVIYIFKPVFSSTRGFICSSSFSII